MHHPHPPPWLWVFPCLHTYTHMGKGPGSVMAGEPKAVLWTHVAGFTGLSAIGETVARQCTPSIPSGMTHALIPSRSAFLCLFYRQYRRGFFLVNGPKVWQCLPRAGWLHILCNNFFKIIFTWFHLGFLFFTFFFQFNNGDTTLHK